MFQAKKKAWHGQGTAKARVAGGCESGRRLGKGGIREATEGLVGQLQTGFECDENSKVDDIGIHHPCCLFPPLVFEAGLWQLGDHIPVSE